MTIRKEIMSADQAGSPNLKAGHHLVRLRVIFKKVSPMSLRIYSQSLLALANEISSMNIHVPYFVTVAYRCNNPSGMSILHLLETQTLNERA